MPFVGVWSGGSKEGQYEGQRTDNAPFTETRNDTPPCAPLTELKEGTFSLRAYPLGSITSRSLVEESALLPRTLFQWRNGDQTQESGGNRTYPPSTSFLRRPIIAYLPTFKNHIPYYYRKLTMHADNGKKIYVTLNSNTNFSKV